MDATHPPTTYGIAMLRAHPVHEPEVALTSADAAAIREELAAAGPGVQKEMIALRRAGYFV